MGTCGVIHTVDKKRVLKMFSHTSDGRELFAVEKRIYERLGRHSRICRYFGSLEDRLSLVLERLQKTLHTELEEYKISDNQAWLWAIQIAEGLVYLHSKGILHADIGCHNILLDSKGNIKICDFAGSMIDGKEALVCYKTRYQLCTADGGYPISIQSEIFAFGCTMYRIWNSEDPFLEMEDNDVEEHYRKGCFPKVEGISSGSIIMKCWQGMYSNVQEVLNELKSVHRSLNIDNPSD